MEEFLQVWTWQLGASQLAGGGCLRGEEEEEEEGSWQKDQRKDKMQEIQIDLIKIKRDVIKGSTLSDHYACNF